MEVKDQNGLVHDVPDEATPEMVAKYFGVKLPESKTVNTFLGEMPRHLPELSPGTEENKSLIDSMIGAGIGSPGMKMVDAAPKAREVLSRGIKAIFKKPNAKELAYSVQRGHDKELMESSGLYNKVKNDISDRGIEKFPVTKELLDEAKANLPKTRAYDKLIGNAESGDYEAIHKLQSDLGTRGTKALGSDEFATNNIGEEMLDTRNKLNELIENHLEKTGHKDLADTLKQGREQFRKLKQNYYSHPAIAKLVHEESRKIPKNPLSIFSEESKPMKRLLEKHPEVKNALETKENAEQLLKLLKKPSSIGTALGLTGAGIYGTKTVYDLLKGMNE